MILYCNIYNLFCVYLIYVIQLINQYILLNRDSIPANTGKQTTQPNQQIQHTTQPIQPREHTTQTIQLRQHTTADFYYWGRLVQLPFQAASCWRAPQFPGGIRPPPAVLLPGTLMAVPTDQSASVLWAKCWVAVRRSL